MGKKKVISRSGKKVVSSQPPDFKKMHAEWDVTLRKNVYGHAPEEYHFKVVNGEKLKDLKELLHAVHKMNEETFHHHVNDAKNDFSTWVKDVFKNEELAAKLKQLHSRVETELALHQYANKKLERLGRKLFYPGRM